MRPAFTRLGLAILLMAGSARADVITFDELDASQPIPAVYYQMAWTNFFVIATPVRDAGSGYDNGVVSPPNVAFSGLFSTAVFGPRRGNGSFTFVSAELTGAWHDRLNVEIVGRFNGVVVQSTDVVIDATGPTHVELHWTGIDTLSFRSSGGFLHDPDWPEGDNFVIDDIVVADVNSTLVPEPASAGLAILGAAGLALGVWLRRRPGGR